VDAEDPNVKPVPVLVFFAGVGVASIAGGSLVESAPKEKPVLLLSFAVDASAAGVDDAPNENPVPLPLLSSAAVLEAPPNEKPVPPESPAVTEIAVAAADEEDEEEDGALAPKENPEPPVSALSLLLDSSAGAEVDAPNLKPLLISG
jgi:hypothetical protein